MGATPSGAYRANAFVLAGSLVGAIARTVPEHGSVLAAHTARVLMWDLDLRRDVNPGDQVAVVWRVTDDVEVGAVTYAGAASKTTVRAFRFQAPGDPTASYWDENGREVARRLERSPLRSYDQITALLKDRPTHKGMDFKTAVGTPVFAPRTAVVTRANWKTRGNGNCLELRYADGVVAKFLHLSKVEVKPGQNVREGTIVARTGNTGRSTAPHLHYQLSRGATTLDPIAYHGTLRRQLPAASMTAFRAHVKAMEALQPKP